MTYTEALYKLNPKARTSLSELGKYLSVYARDYGLTTSKRQAAFLSNFAHETDRLNSLVEYASGSAYEGRKDLGNIYPGDGKKFKGRGGLMITGRSNYAAVSEHLFNDDRLLHHPELLEQSENAIRSSLYYWKSRGLNELADKGSFTTIVKRINGGLNGWADRLSYLEKLTLLLSNVPITSGVIPLMAFVLLYIAITFLFVNQ